MNFPAISPRRTYLIARRDFLGYVKTWGFWLTALGPFLGIVFGMLAPLLMASSEPTRYAAILDETGLHGAVIEKLHVQDTQDILIDAVREASKLTVPREKRTEFEAILKGEGVEAAKDYIRKTNPIIAKVIDLPESKLKFVQAPASTLEGLKPFLLGSKMLSVDGQAQELSGVLHIYENQDGLQTEFWSIRPNQNALVGLANRYFSRRAEEQYLGASGLSRSGLRKSRKQAPRVASFNPAKSARDKGGQSVTGKDRIPYLAAAALCMVLWFSVFTGAYMLLVSMVEEKINKVLEMLLASTRFSEIFFGKLLGVAALTLASLLPWIILGVVGFYAVMQFGNGEIAAGLSQAVSPKMLFFLPVFFLLGYVFYGSMFIALGALAESMQDASTLMTPMVLLLTGCIMVVPIGFVYPDSPILKAAAWFPFSAPFAALVRLPADPPLWETLGSVLVLVLSSAVVVWLSSKLFQHGVLSGGGMASVKAWFGRVILRRGRAK